MIDSLLNCPWDEAVFGIPVFGMSVDNSGIRYHAQGGLPRGEHFFAEAKYGTATVEGLDVGGLTILAGYRT